MPVAREESPEWRRQPATEAGTYADNRAQTEHGKVLVISRIPLMEKAFWLAYSRLKTMC